MKGTQLSKVCLLCWPSDNESSLLIPLWNHMEVYMVNLLVCNAAIVLQDIVAYRRLRSININLKELGNLLRNWKKISERLIGQVV